MGSNHQELLYCDGEYWTYEGILNGVFRCGPGCTELNNADGPRCLNFKKRDCATGSVATGLSSVNRCAFPSDQDVQCVPCEP